MIHITAYLDGQTVGIGYKYTVTHGATSWRAFRTAKGLKYFLDSFGLKINPELTECLDYRPYGKGRFITMTCKEKRVVDDCNYFYDVSEVPKEAKPYYDLVNGSYVKCYILDKGDEVINYKPNPNAEKVYKPLGYAMLSELIG